MGFTEIYERIKLATNCRTQVELAELLNIRQSSISDAKRRDSVPGDWYMKLFERFGLNPDWLKYGVGPLYLRTDKGYCPQEAPQALAETVACYGDDFTRSTVVDVYDMACVYTDEAPRPALSISGRVPLPQAFLRPSLQVLRLRGQAMEPLLREGAYIGVDMEDLAPVSGRTYALFAPLEGVVVRRRDYESSEDFDAALLNQLKTHHIDLVVLAGFLSVLGPSVIAAYPRRILNVHPALIPSFCGPGMYGLRPHEAALARGCKVTGATVHFVNEECDGGPILLQKAVDILPGDTPEVLQKRVMEQAEWKLLPKAVAMVCSGEIE